MSAITQGLMDTDILDNTGPFYSAIDTEPERAGVFKLRAFVPLMVAGMGDRTAGISRYINPHDGASLQNEPRADVFQGAVEGPVGRYNRSGFNGGFIGGHLVAADRVQGDVGQVRRSTVQRARSQNDVTLPDDQAVAAAFTNPAMANMINRLRGKGKNA